MPQAMTSPAPALPDDITETVRRALAEDVGGGNLTANLIPEATPPRTQVISREDAVLCGTAWFDKVFLPKDRTSELPGRSKTTM
jgi:nicotinate-nucleotide pyrophosphorylase (carboxylating)